MAVKAPRKAYDIGKNNKRNENTRVTDKIKNGKRDVVQIASEINYKKPCCKRSENCLRCAHRETENVNMSEIQLI